MKILIILFYILLFDELLKIIWSSKNIIFKQNVISIHKAPKFKYIPKYFIQINQPNFKHKFYLSFIWLGFVIFIRK